MKVVILDDETYAALAKKLPASAPLVLPDAEQLHDQARNGGTPDAFTLARERIEAADQAAAQTRADLHDLIRRSRRIGIKTGALVEWTGYSPRYVLDVGEGKA